MFGLPEEVGTDRGPQFVSHFRDEVSRILGQTWKLSTSGHSQTQGQVERMNQALQQRILPYLNHYQDNWCSAIPALDAVQASLPQDTTGLSPHEVERGFPMPLPHSWEARTRSWTGVPTQERLDRKAAQEMMKTLASYQQRAREHALAAQETMCRQANKGRREPDFKVGDKVFIIKKVWSTDQASDKLVSPLTHRWFRILSMEGFSYRLEVPPGWKGSQVFHADRLRRFEDNPLPGQAAENPDAQTNELGDDEWEVEEILSSRLYYGKLQYQARWKGWDPDATWYDASSFKNATAVLDSYHECYPDNAGPPMRIDNWRRAARDDTWDEPHPDDNKPQSSRQTRRRTGRKR